jgi:hypothetical protein
VNELHPDRRKEDDIQGTDAQLDDAGNRDTIGEKTPTLRG